MYYSVLSDVIGFATHSRRRLTVFSSSRVRTVPPTDRETRIDGVLQTAGEGYLRTDAGEGYPLLLPECSSQ